MGPRLSPGDVTPPEGLDLWILAGQSNIEGYGILEPGIDPPPNLRVWDFSSAGQWEIAADPLHWPWESITPVHQRILRGRFAADDPLAAMTDAEIAARERTGRTVGTGPGLTFARELASGTGRPIGLIPTALGGTMLAEWAPAPGLPAGDSLYGAMLLRIERALAVPGATLGGLVWFQGEADCTPELAPTYLARLTEWIDGLRRDLHAPELPVLVVQLGRLVTTPIIDEIGLDPIAWSTVRTAQSELGERMPGVAVTAAVDLPLADEIHLSAEGQRRLGRRLARVALGTPAPRLRSVERDAPQSNGKPTLVARFDHVPGGWAPASRFTGFAAVDRHGHPHPVVRVLDVAECDDQGSLRILLSSDETNLHLSYGQGFDPPAMMADRHDSGLLAFGPVEVGRRPSPAVGGAS